jgi:hypothetical protein
MKKDNNYTFRNSDIFIQIRNGRQAMCIVVQFTCQNQKLVQEGQKNWAVIKKPNYTVECSKYTKGVDRAFQYL